MGHDRIMSFSPLDSALTGPLFVTSAMRAVFSDEARLAAMLAFETALARAQAEAGIADAALPEALAAIRPADFDMAALGAETALAAVPVIPFVRQLRGMLPPPLASDLHKGATTQDVLDTALVLQIRDALKALAPDLRALIEALHLRAQEHAHSLCAGRTYGQHAAPVTFGFKLAIWLAGICDSLDALDDARAGALKLSLAGPVGTLAGVGAPDTAFAIRARMADILGLVDAPLPWHARRGGLARLVDALRQLLSSLAHMAGDLAHLASTEVGEIAEPHQPGRGGSSAMPHKRNPVSCTVILAALTQARGLAASLDEAPIGGHERPAGAWHGEWQVLPTLLGLASGALREARVLAQGMEIDVARMRANLDMTRGLLFADAASALLARQMGAAEAQAAVTRAADRVRAEQIDLIDALSAETGRDRADLAPAFSLDPAIAAAAAHVPLLEEPVVRALGQIDRLC
jgi:3-carboxy-cis,cis-muconate cycloisomerase